jgi:hypothetical protein
VTFHSDDWGLVGIRDRASYEGLRSAGLSLSSDPLDHHSCETAEDVRALCDVLSAHRDSAGNPPVFVCSFVLANVDFPRVLDSDFQELHLKPLHEGLPRPWVRDGLVDTYREAVRQGHVFPALHGVTHFCHPAVRKILAEHSPRGEMLRALYRLGTPVLYQHTPWVGFEFRDTGDVLPGGWLSYAAQLEAVARGVELFRAMFAMSPRSACAPGYHATDLTALAWARAGLRIIHHGPGISAPPFLGRHGLLHLYRNISFESAWETDDTLMARAQRASLQMAQAGEPLVVFGHSVNFHSALQNYRHATLERLDRFLTFLEQTFDDLLYVHDGDLWDLARTGRYYRAGQEVRVEVVRRWTVRGRVRSARDLRNVVSP